jgi:hypothetical protein
MSFKGLFYYINFISLSFYNYNSYYINKKFIKVLVFILIIKLNI